MEPDELQKKTTTPEVRTPNPTTPDTNSILKPLRTYERDIADMIRAHQTSTVDIVLAQRNKIEAEKVKQKPSPIQPLQPVQVVQSIRKEEPPEPISRAPQTIPTQTITQKPTIEPTVTSQPINQPRTDTGGMNYIEPQRFETGTRNRILVTISIIFILAGSATFLFLFILNVFQKRTEEISQTKLTLLISDEKKELDLLTYVSAGQITERFSSFTREAFPNDYIVEVSIVRKEGGDTIKATPESFFGIAAPNIPASLTRAFDQKMFAGIYTFTDKHPFLIVTVDAFDKAFEGMLSWEKDMYRDIGSLVQTQKVNSALLPGIPLGEFTDMIVQNKDTRVLKNNQGEIILMYSFIDEDILFIVNNERTFKEISNRFSATKLIR